MSAVAAEEYDEGVVTSCELVWGEGFLSPGGEGNVANLVDGIDVRGRLVLDIGCGLGGPACALADRHGAHVVGSDLEAPLLQRARTRARERGLGHRFFPLRVEPGPLAFRDGSFSAVVSSGAFTQTADKLGTYRECLRVLEPGGWISAYDWMQGGTGPLSEAMRHWLELEGLTYALDTPERCAEQLSEAGFVAVEVTDRSDWYRAQSVAEYEAMRTEHHPDMVERLGRERADQLVECWRALAVVCERRELLQVYSRGRKPLP